MDRSWRPRLSYLYQLLKAASHQKEKEKKKAAFRNALSTLDPLKNLERKSGCQLIFFPKRRQSLKFWLHKAFQIYWKRITKFAIDALGHTIKQMQKQTHLWVAAYHDFPPKKLPPRIIRETMLRARTGRNDSVSWDVACLWCNRQGVNDDSPRQHRLK